MEFWEVYDSHYARVRAFILLKVKDEWAAEDIIQETFIRVHNNLHKLRDKTKLTSWLFSIAYNQCQDHFRKTSRLSKNENGHDLKQKLLVEPLFQLEFDQHQMGACVKQKIELLPEPYQTVLTLFELMDFSLKEIAQILDISIENVKIRLHRARKKLKQILEQACNFETDERNVLVCTPVDIHN